MEDWECKEKKSLLSPILRLPEGPFAGGTRVDTQSVTTSTAVALPASLYRRVVLQLARRFEKGVDIININDDWGGQEAFIHDLVYTKIKAMLEERIYVRLQLLACELPDRRS